MFVLLSGSYPYAGSSIEELLGNILKNPVLNLDTRVWKKVSDNGKDLLVQLLQVEPKKRIKAKDALEHSWFRKFCPAPVPDLDIV